MLSKEQIEGISRILDRNGKVGKAWLFGSFARNEETLDSDVDILFAFKEGKSFGYLELFGIVNQLEALLHRPVEFIRAETLLPFVIESANSEKVLIYDCGLPVNQAVS
jgi:hypothetical protein